MLPNTFTGVISAASHILWQNFLDIQDGAFYTSPHKKEVLINDTITIAENEEETNKLSQKEDNKLNKIYHDTIY
jgi:hypothetical protein